MGDESGSFEYEHKLYSLKILNEAQKLGLINKEQYTIKQNEFLKSIHFSVDDDDDEANSIHAAELLHRTSQGCDEEYRPRSARKRMPSSRGRQYEFEELPRRKRVRRHHQQMSHQELDRVQDEMNMGEVSNINSTAIVSSEGGLSLLSKGTEMLQSPEGGEESGKEGGGGGRHHKTFSEFIFAALRHLGGEAELQQLYQYVYDNRDDIDPRFSYRFKTGDYKSNVRSTLHNTGSFHKNSSGKWTIDAPLKGRGRAY